ncbi:MAG: hypothetical protein AAB535_04290 [Patescibacteria group bacterium]
MKNLAIDLAPPGGFKGFGKLGLENGSSEGALGIFSNFISSAIGLMTIIAIIWFIFTFIIGAIGIITAGSDKNTLESARKKIITGIIGLVVTIAAIFVVDLISTLLGFGGVGLLNLEGLFSKIIE